MAMHSTADSDSSHEWETASDDEVAELLCDLVKNIASASGSGKAQVCCQGAVQLDALPVIFGENPHGALFAVHLPLKHAGCTHEGVAHQALQPLLDACEPASFGKGSEEVYPITSRLTCRSALEKLASSSDTSTMQPAACLCSAPDPHTMQMQG